MKIKKTFIIFIICFVILNLTLVYATDVNISNYKLYFRVHIIANSDSIDDQLLKYKIAKEVNNYIANITKSSSSKEESKKIIEDNMQTILEQCNSILKKENSDYTVKAYLGKMKYDKKEKNDTIMKAGIYDSLKIVIGDGNGQNWWSLIYPSTLTEVDINEAFDEHTTFSLGIVQTIKSLFK